VTVRWWLPLCQYAHTRLVQLVFVPRDRFSTPPGRCRHLLPSRSPLPIFALVAVVNLRAKWRFYAIGAYLVRLLAPPSACRAFVVSPVLPSARSGSRSKRLIVFVVVAAVYGSDPILTCWLTFGLAM